MSLPSTRFSVLASWLLATVLLLGGCAPSEVRIAINPSSATVAAEGSFVFTAHVSGGPGGAANLSVTRSYYTGVGYGSGVLYAPNVRWRILEAGGGSVSTLGGYFVRRLGTE